VLLFSGSDDGYIRKYERLQLNTFMYSQEQLVIPKDEVKKKRLMIVENDDSKTKIINPYLSAEEKRRQHAARHKEVGDKLDSWKRTTITV
jgi:hypothetical protein